MVAVSSWRPTVIIRTLSPQTPASDSRSAPRFHAELEHNQQLEMMVVQGLTVHEISY